MSGCRHAGLLDKYTSNELDGGVGCGELWVLGLCCSSSSTGAAACLDRLSEEKIS